MENHLKKGEIIGRNIEITEAKNKANIGINGKVIDETKNTLKIMTQDGTKTLIKSNITIKDKASGTEIKGKEIQLAPEDRIKTR